MLATEGVLSKVKGCPPIECSEIVESDHRGCLTDVDFVEHFAEKFIEEVKTRKETQILIESQFVKMFLKKCDQSLDSANVENELKEANSNFCRAKIEQLDADTTHVLSKARNVQKVT